MENAHRDLKIFDLLASRTVVLHSLSEHMSGFYDGHERLLDGRIQCIVDARIHNPSSSLIDNSIVLSCLSDY